MASRAYHEFPERKLGTPKKSTDHRGGPAPSTAMPEKTAGYPAAGAKAGAAYNRKTQARVVKAYVAKAGLP